MSLYPHLRLSLFCGEALTVEVARDWSLAAPNSIIENIYGPTELTIGCTAYRWNNQNSPAECEHGIVPIGEPFENMKPLIVDHDLREVATGDEGELRPDDRAAQTPVGAMKRKRDMRLSP